MIVILAGSWDAARRHAEEHGWRKHSPVNDYNRFIAITRTSDIQRLDGLKLYQKDTIARCDTFYTTPHLSDDDRLWIERYIIERIYDLDRPPSDLWLC